MQGAWYSNSPLYRRYVPLKDFPIVFKPCLLLILGPTDLPAPNAGLTLQYVAIGRGVQNYTCSAVGAVPVQQGAKATLFDATTLAKTNENLLHTIPAIVVYWPLPSDSTAQLYNLPVLGHHYFDSASTPTFDLTAVNKIGFMQKTVGVAAPAGANVGPDKTSAVSWLDLNNKPGYVSKSITQVYRVETAGGNPYATCNSTDLMEIEYAAEYWFYN